MAPPLLKCVDMDDCRRPGCNFVHPNEAEWQTAGESRVYRERKAAGMLGRRDRDRGSESRSQRGQSAASAEGRGKSSSSKGWGSPDPPASSAWGASSATSTKDSGWGASGGKSDSGWGNTSSGGGWDSSTTSGAGAGWGESKPSGGGGWGDSNTTSTTSGGWGGSNASSGWGDANTSGNWGDSGSRRSSTSFDRPRSPRARDKPASSDRSVSSSKGKDRERDRHDRDTSPSRTHPSSTEKASSLPTKERHDNPRSSEPSPSTAKPSDAMDIDPPSAVTPSLSSAKETTPVTPSTEMPISIPFARPAAPLGAAPLGSAPRTASLLSSQAPVMAPPPPPSAGLPARPATVTASTTPVTPTTPTPAAVPLAVAPAPKPPAKPSPPPPVQVPKTPTQASPSPDRPYEWIGLLQDVIKQNRALKLAKQQVDHSQSLETPSTGRDPPGMGSLANSLSKQRAHVETLEKEMQTLLVQFAAHFEQFTAGKTGPAPIVNGATKGVVMDDGTLRQLSNDVSRLQSEFKLLEAEREILPDLRKVTDEAKRIAEAVKKGVEDAKKGIADVSSESKALQDAVKKEQDARTKGFEDVRKEVKVLGDEVKRVKVESDRSCEELVKASASLEQVRCDVQVLRDEQSSARSIVDGVKTEVDGVKQEAQNVRTGAESTKAEVEGLTQVVGQVKTELGGVSSEVGAIRIEVDKLKKELVERQVPATPKAKRNRNGITPPADAMDVDEPRPAKRPRTGDVATSPRAAVIVSQPDSTRLQDLEDYVSQLENELVQISADVKERLDEFGTRVGVEPIDSLVTVSNQPEVSPRGGSAPPGSSPKVQIARTAGRSSAPPQVGSNPEFMQQLDAIEEEDGPSVQRDLSAVMGQMVKLWGAEGEWPGVVGRNLCKVLKVESLDEIKPKQPKAVNGSEEGEVVDDGLATEVKAMREEMRKEREEHAKRMDAMLQRIERTESTLERVEKERKALAEENRLIKEQQTEQSKLLAHIQSVMDNLPRPQNGALSPEALAHDAVRSGASPVQREMEAIRRLAVIVPSLMSLAGVSE